MVKAHMAIVEMSMSKTTKGRMRSLSLITSKAW
jgi:hypothetical protein